jgi:molybdopterin-synthase adenylyltransferase
MRELFHQNIRDTKMNSENQKLKLLPVQLIESDQRMILKRGRTEIKIDGEGAEEVVALILEATSGAGATPEEICKQFAAPHRPTVQRLIEHLLDKRILVPAEGEAASVDVPESGIDIFHWHFGLRTEQVNERLNNQHIAIVGVNSISRQLVTALTTAGVEEITVVDYPLLRNLRLFHGDGALRATEWPASAQHLIKNYEVWTERVDLDELNCLVAASDFGGQHLLRPWNKFCLKHSVHFLPVVLQDLIGYVGPLVIPGETACLECLRARQNAHLRDIEAQRAADYHAFDGQVVTGFHPSMASILGDIAAIELSKFYGGLREWQVGALIEVNLLATKMTARKVLRIPRCMVCSNLNRRSAITPKKNALMPGNQYSSRYEE